MKNLEESIYNKLVEKPNPLENHQYIQRVLGISLPLNESGAAFISENMREEILEEHILYENFLRNLANQIKTGAREVKQLFQAFYSMVADKTGDKIEVFTKYLSRLIKQLRKKLEGVLNKFAGDTLLEEKIKEKIQILADMYDEAKGWKRVMLGSTVYLVITYLVDKVEDAIGNIKSGGNLKDELIDRIVNSDFAQSILKTLGNPEAWLGWIGPVVGGTKFVAKVLNPITSRVSHDPESLVNEEKKPNPKDHTTLSIEDMEDAVRKAQSAKKVADEKKLRKNIPGDEYRKLPTVSDKFQIIVPMSTRASCLYGAGTKWCTAASEDNQFNRYYNRWGMTLYYVLPKKVDVDWDVVDAEKEDFHNQLDDLFEGKVQDLKKKYPEWNIGAFKDPSGKNKYLDWMVKTAVQLVKDGEVFGTREEKQTYAVGRINNTIDYYHKLLPYIGREDKPEKKKEKTAQERTRYDKLAIVMHPEGYRSKIYDAEDKDVHLKDVISYIMPTWGIDAKEGLDVFTKVEDVIDADMKENPNPVRDRMNKIKKEVESLSDDLDSTYHDKLKPDFFDNPENASSSPVAYGRLNNTRVEPGELVIPFSANFYFPIPDEIGGYEKMTKDRTFRGNDRGRLDSFKGMLRQEMNLWKPAVEMDKVTLKSFRAAKEKYSKELGESQANTIFKERFPREADIEYVGPVTKQRFIFLDLRASIKIRDTVGAIPAEDIDNIMLNVVGDIRNFMEDGIQKVKEQAWEEFQFMAKRWMEQNPRKSPEEEKIETEKSVDDIMKHLDDPMGGVRIPHRGGRIKKITQEKQTMSLEEKILAKLMGEELLLEVDYEQAQASLTGKPAQKLVKSFNFDQGKDPTDDMSRLVTRIRNNVMTTVPHDVLPGEVANDPSMDAIGKEKEIEKRRALGIMWMLRLLKKDKELTAQMLRQGDTTFTPVLRQLKQDMEKFFQHNRHMKVKDLNQLQTADDLNKVVDAAQKSIDAENDKKMGADAGRGTEFFAGGFKTDDEGNIMRDEEGIPLFRFSKDGWVIAAAHNKGAACLLGKKTNWCTAAPGLNYFKTYYNGEDDPIFFIHTPGAGEGYDGDRFQFAFGCDDCPQFMDVEDTPVRGNEFEELHNKLKDVLRDNGFEDRFEVVFNYEHFDFYEAMEKLLKDERARIDNPQVQITGEVEDDYDSTNLIGHFDVAFIYHFDPNKFTPVDDIYDTEAIQSVFQDMTNMKVGGQEDSYGDEDENVGYDAGHSSIKLDLSGWLSSWASSEARGPDVMHEIDGFFSDVNYNIDGKYDELKAKLQVALVEYGALPLTEYDKLLSDEIAVWDGEHANQDDEDEPGEYGDPSEKPEPKDKAERQEAFEEQFKNVLVAFDDDNGEINFQGLSFPAPADLANDKVSIIGDTPKYKQAVFRKGLSIMKQVIDRQPNLPGIKGGDDEVYLDMLQNVANRNDIVGYMFTYKSTCKLEIVMKLGTLTESEMDSIVEGMKVIDRNFKLFQISMRESLERYIEKNPSDVRREEDKPGAPAPGVQQGEPIGARIGTPVRAESALGENIGTAAMLRKAKSGYEAAKERFVAAEKSGDKKEADEMFQVMMNKKNLYNQLMKAPSEGLAEIIADEVTKAMNEIEPYQKKAKKLQKKAMQLTIKGPNKHMPKGMKIAKAKPGKSAPPGG